MSFSPRGLPPAPLAGDEVSGKYRLLRRIGEGGMGLVFEATHTRLRQGVAIKFLRSDALLLPDAVDRFEREARISSRIGGPHVVRALDVDTDDVGRPYLVMELLRGRDLEAEIQARGPLPVADAVGLILQACTAVAAAHAAGVIHRDLKPSNLFLADEGGRRVLKVLDFGVSKSARDAEPAATSVSTILGTPLYMSPEQVRSSKDVDARTDVWSLGVVLYELIVGTPPFRGSTTAAVAAIVAGATPSLRDVRPEVSVELERVIATALSKNAADRFPTVEALSAALVPFVSPHELEASLSLRPSRRAAYVARKTIARAPSNPRASSALDLLEMPTASDTTASSEPPWCIALRTFAGAMAVGAGLATAVALAAPTGSRLHVEPEHPATTVRGADVASVRSTESTRTTSRALCSPADHVDCLKPSGSSGAGGSSIRRSSDP